MNSHEIDYNIFGDDLQCVEIELDPNETVIAEAGSMMMMDQSIEMNTILGDGSKQDESIFGKLFGRETGFNWRESFYDNLHAKRTLKSKSNLCRAVPR